MKSSTRAASILLVVSLSLLLLWPLQLTPRRTDRRRRHLDADSACSVECDVLDRDDTTSTAERMQMYWRLGFAGCWTICVSDPWRFFFSLLGFRCGSCFEDDDPTAMVVLGPTSSDDFTIVSCNSTTVEIAGLAASNIIASDGGNLDLFLYLAGGETLCDDCFPLARRIASIQTVGDGDGDRKILTTTFATLGGIFADGGSQEIEPLINCQHSGGSARRRATNYDHRSLQRNIPVDCEDWLAKDTEGNCLFSDCVVGPTGDVEDCFHCGADCPNGCGPEGFSSTLIGNFLLFDFNPSCCSHDYCFQSAIFEQSECDLAFYEDNRALCPFQEILNPVTVVLSGGILAAIAVFCEAMALLAYLAVAVFGASAAARSRENQIAHLATDICSP